MDFYRNYIGLPVRKSTHLSKDRIPSPFKSTFKINKIKDVIEHPIRKVPAFTFLEDDSYVACEGCRIYPFFKFDSSKILELYPNSKIISIESFTKKGLPWTKLEIPEEISLEEQFLHCKFLGAEAINLKVFHNNQFVYPDYKIEELVTGSRLKS